jgi:hypothetical protein
MAALESGQVIGSVIYRISTTTDPAVAPEQRVTVVIAGATIELVAAGQAKLVARGDMWRFIAVQRV